MSNRKRGGEVERISPLENVLWKTFARVVIAGKRGRTVPILFTSSMQRNIYFLIKTRKDVGVRDNNHHLIPFGSLSPIRSSDSLYSFSRECVVTKPENITSINLRKHVAAGAALAPKK